MRDGAATQLENFAKKGGCALGEACKVGGGGEGLVWVSPKDCEFVETKVTAMKVKIAHKIIHVWLVNPARVYEVVKRREELRSFLFSFFSSSGKREDE